MKKLEIASQVSLLDEAYVLLYQWINNNDIENTLAQYADRYQTEVESYNKKRDIMLEMYHYVTDHMKTKRDRIEYYFKERNPQFSTFATLALLLDEHRSSINEIPAYQERMKELTPERRVLEFAMYINCEEAANLPQEELATEADLVSFLESSSYDTASKWETIKIFNNQEIYYLEASQILEEARDLLNSGFGSRIEELSEEFYKYWGTYQENHDMIDTFQERLKISWRKSDKGCILKPSIFRPFSISISVDVEENKYLDVIRLGIMLDDRFDMSDHKIKKEDVVEIGKLFSDKSKVDILEFVSQKPRYGKEIANELNLTTATISYHVNALLKINFLQAEVISNKVYYSINRDMISIYLENVKDFFNKL